MHSFAKAHVKIPFIIGGEGLDTATDGMTWQFFEVRCPVRVDAPIRLAVTAEPVGEFGAAFVFGHFGSPMKGHKAAPAFHLSPELFEMVALESWMAGVAIRVNEDGVGSREFLWGGPIGIEVNFDVELSCGVFSETPGEEKDTRVVFV